MYTRSDYDLLQPQNQFEEKADNRIHLAAAKGDIESMTMLISMNPECVNQFHSIHGTTPICWALQNNQQEAIKLLLKNKASLRLAKHPFVRFSIYQYLEFLLPITQIQKMEKISQEKFLPTTKEEWENLSLEDFLFHAQGLTHALLVCRKRMDTTWGSEKIAGKILEFIQTRMDNDPEALDFFNYSILRMRNISLGLIKRLYPGETFHQGTSHLDMSYISHLEEDGRNKLDLLQENYNAVIEFSEVLETACYYSNAYPIIQSQDKLAHIRFIQPMINAQDKSLSMRWQQHLLCFLDPRSFVPALAQAKTLFPNILEFHQNMSAVTQHMHGKFLDKHIHSQSIHKLTLIHPTEDSLYRSLSKIMIKISQGEVDIQEDLRAIYEVFKVMPVQFDSLSLVDNITTLIFKQLTQQEINLDNASRVLTTCLLIILYYPDISYATKKDVQSFLNRFDRLALNSDDHFNFVKDIFENVLSHPDFMGAPKNGDYNCYFLEHYKYFSMCFGVYSEVLVRVMTDAIVNNSGKSSQKSLSEYYKAFGHNEKAALLETFFDFTSRNDGDLIKELDEVNLQYKKACDTGDIHLIKILFSMIVEGNNELNDITKHPNIFSSSLYRKAHFNNQFKQAEAKYKAALQFGPLVTQIAAKPEIIIELSLQVMALQQQVKELQEKLASKNQEEKLSPKSLSNALIRFSFIKMDESSDPESEEKNSQNKSRAVIRKAIP